MQIKYQLLTNACLAWDGFESLKPSTLSVLIADTVASDKIASAIGVQADKIYYSNVGSLSVFKAQKVYLSDVYLALISLVIR